MAHNMAALETQDVTESTCQFVKSMSRRCIIASFYIVMRILTSSRHTMQTTSTQLLNAPVKKEDKQ